LAQKFLGKYYVALVLCTHVCVLFPYNFYDTEMFSVC
jgi:hypothetical protein